MLTDVCWNCGATFELPEDRAAWDVRTAVVEGVEVIVERSITVACPACGKSGAGRPDADPEAFNGGREDVDPPEPFDAGVAERGRLAYRGIVS